MVPTCASGRTVKAMHGVPRGSVILLQGMAAALAVIVIGCSDHADTPSDGPPDESPGGTSGSSGASEGGRPGAGEPMLRPMRQNCDPHEDPEQDACLACLTRDCCGELLACEFTAEWPGPYPCYTGHYRCVRDCFEAAVEDGSTESSEDVTLACSVMCPGSTAASFQQQFLACAVGTPVPSDDERDAGAEDGGSDVTRTEEDTCADVCRFPSWR